MKFQLYTVSNANIGYNLILDIILEIQSLSNRSLAKHLNNPYNPILVIRAKINLAKSPESLTVNHRRLNFWTGFSFLLVPTALLSGGMTFE